MNELIKRGLALALTVPGVLAATRPAQAAPVVGVFQSTQINGKTTLYGWACLQGGNTQLSVHIYVGGPYPTGTIIAGLPASSPPGPLTQQCGDSLNHFFSYEIPQPVLDAYPGKVVYAYGVCSGQPGCANTLLSNSGSVFLPFRFSSIVGQSWGDGHDYFQEWHCTSSIGINHIYRLDIAPLGTHPINVWKDSLWADMSHFEGGNPVIHFTASKMGSTPIFSLAKATFNGTKWVITEVQDDPSNDGGISSQDAVPNGTGSDYMMNEYYTPGWGPMANHSSGGGIIPGVLATSSKPNLFALWGTGPYGLTTIQNIHGPSTVPGYESCLHMNPTFFDFNASGQPQSFLACLFTGPDTAIGCALPSAGTPTPPSTHYAYHYVAGSGWQLDTGLQLHDLLGNCAGGDLGPTTHVGAVNYIQGSNRQFFAAVWDGGIKMLDLNTHTANTVLSCSGTGGTNGNVNFGEPSGRLGAFPLIFMIVAPPGAKNGPAAGLLDGVWVHDIYLAAKTP